MFNLFRLLRIEQWYKNIVIFLPIIFAVKITNTHLFILTIIGFFALCLISSGNYIINDIVDRNKDKLHPEKKLRPVAAGKISSTTALIIAIITLSMGFFIGSKLSIMFLILEIILFVLTTAYTLLLKKEPFVDVLIISTNFTIRAIAGTYVAVSSKDIFEPVLEISPWLILCPFFLALFLALGKKYADLLFLGNKAINHKESYNYYKKSNLESYMTISTTLLIMSYSLFSFLSIHRMLLATLPFALYSIFRYYYFIDYKPEIARNPHKIIFDSKIMIAGILWFIIAVLTLIF